MQIMVSKYKKKWLKVLLALSITPLVVVVCMAEGDRSLKSKCIKAEGKWSYGSHMLPRVELKKGSGNDVDVQISCRGRYEVHLGLIPKETVSVVADDNGVNAYVDTVFLENGSTQQRYLKPHSISYSVTLRSLSDPQKMINLKKKWVVPTYPGGMEGISIQIPKDFFENELFSIRTVIDPDKGFYDDYQWLGISIRVPLH